MASPHLFGTREYVSSSRHMVEEYFDIYSFEMLYNDFKKYVVSSPYGWRKFRNSFLANALNSLKNVRDLFTMVEENFEIRSFQMLYIDIKKYTIDSLQLFQIDSKTYVISSSMVEQNLEIHSLQVLKINSKTYAIPSLWLKKILKFSPSKCLKLTPKVN